MASYHNGALDSAYIPSSHHITTTSDIDKIRDWLPWSIINIFIGWGIGGIIPLIFTVLCRQNKRNNDANGARTMGKLALIFNIVVTFSGIAGWISLIILLVYSRKLMHASYPK